MIGAQFIAARTEHQHCAKQGDATTEVFYKIERCIVGPVYVLEEENRRAIRMLKRIQQRRKKPLGRSRLVQQCRHARLE
jgi:hypothetical protein